MRDENMNTSIEVPEDTVALINAFDDWNWLIIGLFNEHMAFRGVLEYFVSDKRPKLSEIEIVQLENKLCTLESGVQYAVQHLNELKPILLRGLARYGDEEAVRAVFAEWCEKNC
jgi:hypothetical protein